MAACRLEAVSSSYLQWAGNPTNRVPVCGETGQWRDFGIACQPRGLWRRSGHSTRMPGVMLRTWGRAAGLWRCPRPCGGGREPQGDKRSRQTKFRAWRARCHESGPAGSGRGGWKRAALMKLPEGIFGMSKEKRYLAGRPLHEETKKR